MRRNPRRYFVQFAGVGIYGDKGERICDETTAPGDDFVGRGLSKWEAAFDSIDSAKYTQSFVATRRRSRSRTAVSSMF